MIDKVLVSESNLTAIADAIRAKAGTTTKYKPAEMASAISGITTGGGGGTDTGTEILDGSITTYSNDTITYIRDFGLSQCPSLTTLSLPALTAVGTSAFSACPSLTTAYLPAAKSVNCGCFSSCIKLTSVTLTSAEHVEEYGFSSCSSLTTVSLPACETLSDFAFYECSSLTALILGNDTVAKLYDANAFSGTPIESGTGYIYVPDSIVDQYKSDSNWSTYAAQIKPISSAPAA